MERSDRHGSPRRTRSGLRVALLVAGGLLGAVPAHAQSESDLAKQTQNPISDLISLPFQNNVDFGLGPDDGTGWTLNIQPVVPFAVNEDWNVVTRTILPVRTVPSLAPGLGSEAGLGDLDFTAWLSPREGIAFEGADVVAPEEAGSIVWGVGAALLMPTATDDLLGTGKWSAGPTAVGLVTKGPWVAGGLIKHFWSYAGDRDRTGVNLTVIQPFVNYNLSDGWYLVTAPIMTANWKLDDEWLVPIGGGAGKVLKLGGLPINTQLQAFWNAAKPDGPSADWQLRFQVQLLFPR